MATTRSLGLTLGAIEIGVLLSSVLWGVTCVQAFLYATSPNRDRAGLKVIVTALFIMESLHMLFTWVYFYGITVSQFGDMEAIASVPWMLNAAFVMHTSVSAIVQAFFSYRVWKLSDNVWFAIPPWVVASVRFGFSMAVIAFLAKNGIAEFTAHRWLGDLALVLSMVVDIYNTTLPICYLDQAKNRASLITSRVISSILALTMGFSIMLVAIFGLISWILLPESALWIAAILVYARLYSNSLLVSLNARQMRKRDSFITSTRFPSDGIRVERTFETGREIDLLTKSRCHEGYGVHDIPMESIKGSPFVVDG